MSDSSPPSSPSQDPSKPIRDRESHQSFSSSIRPPTIPNIPPRTSTPVAVGSPLSVGGGVGVGAGAGAGLGGYGSIPKSIPRSTHRGSVPKGSFPKSSSLTSKRYTGANKPSPTPGSTLASGDERDDSSSLRGLGEKKDLPSTTALLGTSASQSGVAAQLAARSGKDDSESSKEPSEQPKSIPRSSSGLVVPTSSSNTITGGTSPTPKSIPKRSSDSPLPATAPPSDGEMAAPITPSSISDIPDSAKAEIIRRHLVSAHERQAGEAERRGSNAGGSSGVVGRPPLSGVNSPGSSGVVVRSEIGTPRDGEGLGDKGKSRSRSRERGRETNSAATSAFEGVAATGSDRSAVDLTVEGDGQSGVLVVGAEEDGEETFPLPFDAHGGDVTHGIYKWQNAHRPVPPSHRRAASFSAVPHPKREDSMTRDLDPSLQHLHEVGGFRRQFVRNQAVERGEEGPRMLRSFVDFLFLYGHFAGEDLDEEEDESDIEEADGLTLPRSRLSREGSPVTTARRALSRGPSALPTHMMGERAPLLSAESRSTSKTRHKRSRSMGPHGDATVTQAVMMLLKGFVGTGVLFLGKAFFNGGILFSTIVMLGIASISLWSFLLLVKTRLVVPGGFGEIGGTLYGNWLRTTILTSIALSQVGFVAAYTIFVGENMQAFILAVTDCRKLIEIKYLILAQLVIFLPLSMIRNLAALSSTALIADAFILVGLIYIGSNEVKVIATKGVADVALFNKEHFSLLIGTAVFAFEGIGLVIPITESMREPHKFPKVLSGVMVIVAILFSSFGVMGYMAYGSDIQTVVIVNLPQDQKFVQVVQCLYSVAILLSAPLQLFPAVRIMENALFVKSGKHNPQVKWQKNIFRACTVVGCSLISWAGAGNLDGFVSIIGSFACIPLCFIYPPMLHLRGRASTRTARWLDYGLIVFGVIAAVYTTIMTAKVLITPETGGPGPKFGKCDSPSGA